MDDLYREEILSHYKRPHNGLSADTGNRGSDGARRNP